VERCYRYFGCCRILAIADFQQRGRRWIRIQWLRHDATTWGYVTWILANIASWILSHVTFPGHLARILAHITLPGCRWLWSNFSSILAFISSILAHFAPILAGVTSILADITKLLSSIAGLWWTESRWTTILACISRVFTYQSLRWRSDIAQIQSC
jgi:hypothetical protein